MPLNTVCTVDSRPRLWSSYTNIRIKDAPRLNTMNSTEEISVYRDPYQIYHSPTLSRRTLNYSYDFPEKPTKKEKKWSIGSLFRRKKKDESESSSEGDRKKGFLSRRKKKPDGKKKKHAKTLGTFDHVVVPPRSSLNMYNHREESGVLSDPSCGFTSYSGRPLPKVIQGQNDINESRMSLGSGSIDSLGRKSRREQAKARAVARRTTLKHDSSSDEDSIRSNSSLRIRSDENLGTNRKSRAARTERYLKRHSRDGENPHNYLRLSKSDVEHTGLNWRLNNESSRSPSRSPIFPPPSRTSYTQSNSISSGLSTIPPSHAVHNKLRISNSTCNPSYKPPVSMNDYNNTTTKSNELNNEKHLNNQHSVSCDSNINKTPSSDVNLDHVIHVQFPIAKPNRGYRNLSLIETSQVNRARQPPQPPPRDPKRSVVPHYLDGGRPNTCYFEGPPKCNSFHTSHTKKTNSFSFNPNYRSTSEQYLSNDLFQVNTQIRPSSATPEPQPSKCVTRRREINPNTDSFNYLTDKKPRSRKPIFIQTNGRNPQVGVDARKGSPTQKALDFWKQIDENVNNSVAKSLPRKSNSNSPIMFTSQTRIQTQVFLPSAVQNAEKNKHLEARPRNSSPFKPVSPTVNEIKRSQEVESQHLPNTNLTEVTKDDVKRKSSNLEEALDELEAIYNSLRLGDEDLLERAEQREKETTEKKLREANLEHFSGYGFNKGALSDSSFSYEPFDQVDSPRRKRIVKKCRIPDTKHDDMYNRKLIREKSATIADPQSVISKVSYLLASPVHTGSVEDDTSGKDKNNKEPDVTFDDVVYRNVKHANNSLKVTEPQPPFGIPIGPVAPAANSDYLHASADNIIYPPPYKHRKIPDIVKDDLAFRNLRKDQNKEPILPPLEDYKNAGLECNKVDLNYLKKRRAVRSLSANIGSLVQKPKITKPEEEEGTENEFKTRLTDIADSMEIARRVLQEKDKRITNTRKAFMSDTDANRYTHSESIRESRLNFLNGLKSSLNNPSRLGDEILFSKPPRGLTPTRSLKEPTPIPKSPSEEKSSHKPESTNSSFDDLLNALSVEAKETTERITEELNRLGEERKRLNNQNLLECVVDSTELMSKIPTEEVEQMEVAAAAQPESANVVMSCYKNLETEEDEVKKEIKIESDHDYENLISDTEMNVVETISGVAKSSSPFEEKKLDLKTPEESPEEKKQSSEGEKDSNYENSDEGERSFVECLARKCDLNRTFNSNNTSEDDASSGFHSNVSDTTTPPPPGNFESLKSPKLVLETSKTYDKAKDLSRDDLQLPRSSGMVLAINKRHFGSRSDARGGRVDDFKPSCPWYRDATTVALACSYGVACAHQLCSLDLVAILGILFAVISFIAALFL